MRFPSSPSVVLICVLLLVSYAAPAYGLKKYITGKDGAGMSLIPGGTFDMGSNDEDLIETASLHRVYISDFYMDIHPVTNGQFARFLNDTKPPEGPEGARDWLVVLRSDLEDKERKDWWPTEIAYEGGRYVAYKGYIDHPVVSVSWNAAFEYCKWAGKRLPTEAEWEKAARGGLSGRMFVWGDEIPTNEIIHGRVWKSNKTAAPLDPAKSGKPNGYGLYNMAGSVWEWCSDWYAPDYYERSLRKDPKGAESGRFKSVRGGSWFNNAPGLRVALRNFLDFMALDETMGFRCAGDIPEKPSKARNKENK
jgi:formylglycine-generating enzyme required for sulfatase activity